MKYLLCFFAGVITAVFSFPSSKPAGCTPLVNHMAQPVTFRYMRVTAYCPCKKCCGGWSDGHTATGYKIKIGDKFVAAPSDIPYGTMINIPDYGMVEVKDRGGAIKGDRLDVFFETHQEALNWGVRWLNVEIVK